MLFFLLSFDRQGGDDTGDLGVFPSSLFLAFVFLEYK